MNVDNHGLMTFAMLLCLFGCSASPAPLDLIDDSIDSVVAVDTDSPETAMCDESSGQCMDIREVTASDNIASDFGQDIGHNDVGNDSFIDETAEDIGQDADVSSDLEGCCCMSGYKVMALLSAGCASGLEWVELSQCLDSQSDNQCRLPEAQECTSATGESCPSGWDLNDEEQCTPADCLNNQPGQECATTASPVTVHLAGITTESVVVAADSAVNLCGSGRDMRYKKVVMCSVSPCPDSQYYCFDTPHVGVYVGVWVTSDGGQCWKRAILPAGSDDLENGISINGRLLLGPRGSPVFLSAGNSIYQSLDSGVTFSSFATATSNFDVVSLSADGTRVTGIRRNGRRPVVSIYNGEDARRIGEVGLDPDFEIMDALPVGGTSNVLIAGNVGGSLPNRRALASVNVETGLVESRGPLSAEPIYWARFLSRHDAPVDSAFLVYVNDGEPRRTNVIKVFGDTITTSLIPADVNPFGMRMADENMLVTTDFFSLNGGADWAPIAELNPSEATKLKAWLGGDFACSSEGDACEYWTWDQSAVATNLFEKSMLWKMIDPATGYKMSQGNLPFVSVGTSEDLSGSAVSPGYATIAIKDFVAPTPGSAIVLLGMTWQRGE